jgi:hypothetical protein
MKLPTARNLRMVVVGLLVALSLAGAFFAVASVAGRNKERLDNQQKVVRTICDESNKLRDAERGLWELIIKTSRRNPNPNLTTTERNRQVKVFRKYINEAFVHLDCGEDGFSAGKPPPLPAPIITRTKINTRTRTRTVFVTVPGRTRTATRTVVICRLPNGKRCK